MLMIQKKNPPQWANQRSVRRCPLVASAEITDLHSGTRLSARISELGVGGCYVDALTPFPEGTLVKLRILRGGWPTLRRHCEGWDGFDLLSESEDYRKIISNFKLENWKFQIVRRKEQTRRRTTRKRPPLASSAKSGASTAGRDGVRDVNNGVPRQFRQVASGSRRGDGS